MAYPSTMFIEINGDDWRAKKIIPTRGKRKAILAERVGATVIYVTVHESKEPERFARISATMYPGVELVIDGDTFFSQGVTRSMCDRLDIMQYDAVLKKLVITYRNFLPFEKAAGTKHVLAGKYHHTNTIARYEKRDLYNNILSTNAD